MIRCLASRSSPSLGWSRVLSLTSFDQVLARRPRKQHSYTSNLQKLPLELLFLVLSELDPTSTICLAMTNKRFLRAAHGSGQPLRIPSGSKHSDCTRVGVAFWRYS